MVPAGKQIIAELRSVQNGLKDQLHSEREITTEILIKITASFKNTALQVIPLGVLFGYWPWLRGYTIYVMSLQSIAMISLSVLIIYFLNPPPEHEGTMTNKNTVIRFKNLEDNSLEIPQKVESKIESIGEERGTEMSTTSEGDQSCLVTSPMKTREKPNEHGDKLTDQFLESSFSGKTITKSNSQDIYDIHPELESEYYVV